MSETSYFDFMRSSFEINIDSILSYKIRYRDGYSLGGFYMITDLKNNKSYIGKSTDYMARLKQHTFPSSNKTEIDRAIKQFGINNFKFFLIHTYTELGINFFNRKMETVYEHRLITNYKTFTPYGYNNRHYGHI